MIAHVKNLLNHNDPQALRPMACRVYTGGRPLKKTDGQNAPSIDSPKQCDRLATWLFFLICASEARFVKKGFLPYPKNF